MCRGTALFLPNTSISSHSENTLWFYEHKLVHPWTESAPGLVWQPMYETGDKIRVGTKVMVREKKEEWIKRGSFPLLNENFCKRTNWASTLPPSLLTWRHTQLHSPEFHKEIIQPLSPGRYKKDVEILKKETTHTEGCKMLLWRLTTFDNQVILKLYFFCFL